MNSAVTAPHHDDHPAILKLIRLFGSERRAAKALGVSRGTLYLLRTHQRKPSPDLAKKIVSATNNRIRKHDLRPDLW